MSETFEEYDLDILSTEEQHKLLIQSQDAVMRLFPDYPEEERQEIITNVIVAYCDKIKKTLGESATDVFAEETGSNEPTDIERYLDYKAVKQKRNPEDSAVIAFKGPKKASPYTADVDYYGQLDT